MANNVHFFKKTTPRKTIGIKLIRSMCIEFLVIDKPVFGYAPSVRRSYFLSILTPQLLYKLGYVAITANEYQKLRIHVLYNLPDVAELKLPF